MGNKKIKYFDDVKGIVFCYPKVNGIGEDYDLFRKKWYREKSDKYTYLNYSKPNKSDYYYNAIRSVLLHELRTEKCNDFRKATILKLLQNIATFKKHIFYATVDNYFENEDCVKTFKSDSEQIYYESKNISQSFNDLLIGGMDQVALETFNELLVMKNDKFVRPQEDIRKCLGFAIYDDTIYYAISGLDSYDTKDENFYNSIKNDVESILCSKVSKIHRCVVGDTFCSFSTNYNRDVEDDQTRIYNILTANIGKNTRIYFNIPYDTLHPQYYAVNPSALNDRSWSCVERKIIGTLKTNKIEIYCFMRPCYFCIPEVTKALYITNSNKKCFEMEVINVNHVNQCDITYTEVDIKNI